MKKALIPLAMMAAAGAASAQSSVTLFGVIDATIEHASASGSGSTSLTRLTNSGYNSSRIGIRGTEDLGGGLSASFWLEGALGNDDGTAGGAIAAQNQSTTTSAGSGLNFNRRSTVSLSGNWGELRAGRDHTPSFWNLTVFDPFGTNGVGASLGFTGAAAWSLTPSGTAGVLTRASNSIGYFLPSALGGFYGQAMVYTGENVQNGSTTVEDGNGYGMRVGYASGPLNVALGYGRTTYAQTSTTGDFHTWNLGAQYDLRVVRLMAQFGQDRRDSSTALDGQHWLLGASVPVGAHEIRASYSSYRVDENTADLADPRTDKLALGYVHNLSKRTALYATVAHVRNSNGAALSLGGSTYGSGVVNGSSTAYDLGIRHTF